MNDFYKNLADVFGKLMVNSVFATNSGSDKGFGRTQYGVARIPGNEERTRKDGNEIIDWFEYDDPEGEDYFTRSDRPDQVMYTPFSFTNEKGETTLGNVVSNVGRGKDGRIMGVELSDGTSLTPVGAKKFFETGREKGSFQFADTSGRIKAKERSSSLFYQGNPLASYVPNGKTDERGNERIGTSYIVPRVLPDSRTKALSDFLRNYRGL